MTTVENDLARRLAEALCPVSLEIADESAAHAGHAGNRGGSHFRVRIVAEAFRGLTPLACHRLVYAAVGDLMSNAIHALAIDARAPGER